MRGDGFRFEKRYLDVGRDVFDMIHQAGLPAMPPFILSIGGQSGCGKTMLAHALLSLFEDRTLYKVLILSQDDYFHLPPLCNHHTRLADIGWVGVNEINLFLLGKHIHDFRRRRTIYTPEVDYELNVKSFQAVDTSEYDVLIVEGTYVSMLKEINRRIFFSAPHTETEKNRLLRGRDGIDNFTYKVLSIEASIIAPHIEFADIVIDKDCKFFLRAT